MGKNVLALLLTAALAFWSLGCESDRADHSEPGSSPAQQEPGSPADAEPGS